MEKVSTLRSDNPVIIKKRKSMVRLLLLQMTARGSGVLCKLNDWRKIKQTSLHKFIQSRFTTRIVAIGLALYNSCCIFKNKPSLHEFALTRPVYCLHIAVMIKY